MASNIEEQLLAAQRILDSKSDLHKYEQLCETVGYRVAYDACGLLMNSNEINSFSDSIFLGFDAVSYEYIIDSYASQNQSVFRYLGVDENLDLPPGHEFYFTESSQGFLDDKVEVKNISRMLPLFEFNGEFMFYHHSFHEPLRGLVSELEGHASVVAPSLVEHINDLLAGLKEGVYLCDAEEIVYPSSWHYRKKLRQGLVEMDEYGEINY